MQEVRTRIRVAAEWRPIERVESRDLSYEDFMTHYVHAGKPVVVSGVASDWPAMRKWTPQHFKERFGARPVCYAEYRLERLPLTAAEHASKRMVKRAIRFKD